jgi:hypothetical protein
MMRDIETRLVGHNATVRPFVNHVKRDVACLLIASAD